MNGAIIPSKLQSLIMYIIAQCGRELGAIELAKIVYLVDLEKMTLTGETITGEKYTRQEKGPLAGNFGNCINQMDGFELRVSIDTSGGNSSIPKHKHALGKRPRFQPTLEPIDLATTKRVLTRIRNLSPIQIESLAYNSEPMKVILSKEREVGRILLGEVVDFSTVKPNAFLTKWRQNQKHAKPKDEKFKDFLAQERAEISELLASLG